jgi:sec-independent protein translocase protein TatC
MKKKKLEKKEMPFLDHLEELRWRILKALASIIILTCAAFPMTTWLLKILTYPNTHLPNPAKLVFLKPTAMMMIRMEVSIAVGFIGSLPIIVFQLWRFVAPGLLSKERNYIFPVILITLFCFILGALFAYYIIIPVMLPFLFSMGTDFIEATININDYM